MTSALPGHVVSERAAKARTIREQTGAQSVRRRMKLDLRSELGELFLPNLQTFRHLHFHSDFVLTALYFTTYSTFPNLFGPYSPHLGFQSKGKYEREV